MLLINYANKDSKLTRSNYSKILTVERRLRSGGISSFFQKSSQLFLINFRSFSFSDCRRAVFRPNRSLRNLEKRVAFGRKTERRRIKNRNLFLQNIK